ncbi:hypothetical protein ACFVIZ_16690 [Streptomyces anulatus]|uniref:hypothetical protein n=1 Tax=Streptomyces anulatus TaxID=1892 RepID=UPI0036343C83
MAARNGLTCGSRVEQDALAEKMKAGAVEHLTFERLDSVDVSFDDAGAPGQGEADDDCIAGMLDSCREGEEARGVVLPDGVEPLR